MVRQQEGNWFQSDTPYGKLFHAELFPGRENSGKLVTLIKQQARLYAEDIRSGCVIIDGPPGIGCPVISACAGTDLGLIVTEPSLMGLHDLKRVLGTLASLPRAGSNLHQQNRYLSGRNKGNPGICCIRGH